MQRKTVKVFDQVESKLGYSNNPQLLKVKSLQQIFYES